MDFLNLLKSLDDAIYEVLIWLMQIPKTLFRTIFQPNWMISYVNTEWEKKPEERFDEYLSPILLWAFIVVLPPIILGIQPITQLISAEQWDALQNLDKLLINILFYLITPLAYLFLIELFNKQPAKRSNLKKTFYLECCSLTPGFLIQFLFAIPYMISVMLKSNFIFQVITLLPLFLGFAISIFYQANFFRVELKTGWLKATILAILAPILISIIIFTIGFVVYLYGIYGNFKIPTFT